MTVWRTQNSGVQARRTIFDSYYITHQFLLRLQARNIVQEWPPLQVMTVQHPKSKAALKRWKGQWANLVIDGSEMLLAYFDSECRMLHQAVWSANPYLSWIYYCGLSSEIFLSAMQNKSSNSAMKILRNIGSLEALNAEGVRKLQRVLRNANTLNDISYYLFVSFHH